MASIVLKPAADPVFHRRHPWIFEGAIAKADGLPNTGETVEVLTSDGSGRGRGAYSPSSQIRVRMWSFDPNEPIGLDFFRMRLQRSLASRHGLTERGGFTAGRLVNAESDGLPGVIVDRYGDFLVCQFLSAGAEYWRDTIVGLLRELAPSSGIYERSDVDVRSKEGLPLRTGCLWGSEPTEPVEIREGACRFLVDVRQGQKTGFYLDQCQNRACLAEYASGAEVLNCFAYTGGFGITALKAGATRVTNIESSADALSLGRRNVELNGIDPSMAENVEGDVFAVLRRYRDSRRNFDLVILDPPKFAGSKSQLDGACRGYKDINLLGLKLLRPNGILFTFSCSGLLTRDLFQKIVADAALDAGRDVKIVRILSQAPDHQTALTFPEGAYLKGLVCRAS